MTISQPTLLNTQWPLCIGNAHAVKVNVHSTFVRWVIRSIVHSAATTEGQLHYCPQDSKLKYNSSQPWERMQGTRNPLIARLMMVSCSISDIYVFAPANRKPVGHSSPSLDQSTAEGQQRIATPKTIITYTVSKNDTRLQRHCNHTYATKNKKNAFAPLLHKLTAVNDRRT